MIANTLAGLAFFVAGLGPGYIFIRVAERRTPRPGRSGLYEAVEMVVVGAIASLASALLVLGLADAVGWLDTRALAREPATYLLNHALVTLGLLLAWFAVAYGAAGLMAWRIYGADKDVDPGGSSWWGAFRRDKPQEWVTRATVELRDGQRFIGHVRGFTPESGDNRELTLVRPLAGRAGPGQPIRELDDDFVLLREQDLLYIAGRYREGPSTGTQPAGDQDGDRTAENSEQLSEAETAL